MKRTACALLAVVVAFVVVIAPSVAADEPKFHPSTTVAVPLGHYVVTLAGNPSTDDVAAMKREVAVIYGANVDVSTPTNVRQFSATMTPAHAKLLSTDPRISEVVDTPRSRPSAAPVSAPSSGHRLTPQRLGYGDNGQSGAYTYDSSGNITAIGADTYLYDAENRLTTSVTRGVTENYTYDAFGNRKSATGATNCLGQTPCAQPLTVSNTTNRLMTINGAAVHYDTPGNITNIDAITGSPATIYTYDGTEMLNESTVGSDDRQYVYTADDERIGVKRGASWTWSVRDLNKKVLREFASVENGGNFAMTGRAWTKDYVWRDGLLLATTTPTGTLHYHLDHLGTPRLITDANGVKVAEHAYYPFGAEINLTLHESPEEEMKFTGHERDIVAGDGHTLDYMHARFDNATLGRFISVDPAMDLKKTIANPQMWNRYAYVVNSPVRYADPDGREHVNEPGFTKPLSDADWSDAPLPIKASFHAIAFGLSLAADEFVIGPAVGKIAGVVGRIFGKSEEAVEAGAKLSRYDDITTGRSVSNRATNVSRAEFGKNLEAEGFTKTVSKDGKTAIFQKGSVKYTLRDTAKSTGGPTAEVFKDGKLVQKIRLETPK